jgi:hypothetical protein
MSSTASSTKANYRSTSSAREGLFFIIDLSKADLSLDVILIV